MPSSSSHFVGEQLRLARLTLGFSLDDLAKAVSATRQYIHQLETGARTPSDSVVHALADVLGVRVAFLYNVDAAGVRPEQCHFRKQQTTPASIISQVLARGTMVDRLVKKLDTILSLPKVDFPDFAVRDADDIERAAEFARRYWGLGDGPITNMMRVAENAGAIVTYFHQLSDRVDALSMDRPRPIIVRNDSKASLVRMRFDLAHEVGHLIMHRGIETGDKVTEDQAHRFSGAFLFPRAAFLTEYPRGRSMNWARLFELKLRWKMSVRAMVRRAFDLKLIDAAQYRTANIQLVKMGQAKVERYDTELPLEPPELLSAALSALEQGSVGGIHRLMDELDISDAMYSLLTDKQVPIRPDAGSSIVRLSDHLKSVR